MNSAPRKLKGTNGIWPPANSCSSVRLALPIRLGAKSAGFGASFFSCAFSAGFLGIDDQGAVDLDPVMLAQHCIECFQLAIDADPAAWQVNLRCIKQHAALDDRLLQGGSLGDG